MISILCVDDEPVLLDLASIFLKRDCTPLVDTALSAAEAIAMMNEKQYDVIISDYEMPEMNGIEFLQYIRDQNDTTPFIIFTGRGREDVAIQALNTGADYYLQKGGDPTVQFAELKNMVVKLAKQKRWEVAQRETEHRLTEIIHHLPDATLAINTNGEIISWNKALAEMTGIPAIQMLGKSDYEYAVPLYGLKRPILIDLVFASDEEIGIYYHDVTRQGNTLIGESDLVTKQGDRKIIWEKATVFFDKSGNLAGGIASIRDVTKFRNDEKKARENEERFRSIFNAVNDAIFVYDPLLGEILDVNQRVCEMFGCTPDEACTKNISCLSSGTPPYREEDVQSWINLAVHEGPQSFRCEVKDRSGCLIPVEVNILLAEITGRKILLIVVRDISIHVQAESGIFNSNEQLATAYEKLASSDEELKKYVLELEETKKELQESKNRLATVIHGSPIPQFVIDRYHHIIFWNEALEKYSGLRSNEVLGTDTHWKAFYQDKRPCLADLLLEEETDQIPDWYKGKYAPSRLLQGAYEATDFFPHMGEDGVWLYFTAAQIRDIDGTIVGAIETLEDVTEQKKTEKLLLESKEQYSALFYKNNSISLLIDPETGMITDANSAACVFYGYSYEKITHIPIYSLNRLPEKKVLTDLATAQCEGEKHFFSTHYLSSGEKRSVEVYTGPITVNGKTLLYSIIHDITDRKRAENALKDSEARLQSIIQGCPVPQFVIDNEHNVLFWNSALEKCSNIPATEIIGTKKHWRVFYDHERPCLADILVDDDINMIPRYYEKKVSVSRFVKGAYEGIDFFPLLGESGIWLFFTAAPIRDKEDRIIGAIETLEDITDEKRVSEALIQTNSKLNLLSSITRHDVLNQITALLGYLYIAKDSSDLEQIHEYLTKSEEISGVIQRQIVFTRDYHNIGVYKPEWKNVSLTIQQSMASLDMGQIHVEITTGDLEIYADPLLEKVFFNLLENSLRHGEKVTEIIIFSIKQENILSIVYEDNGSGVSMSEKNLIFERGFGKNTGYGLFLIRHILAITGMSIVENGIPGKGARFEISVPPGTYKNA